MCACMYYFNFCRATAIIKIKILGMMYLYTVMLEKITHILTDFVTKKILSHFSLQVFPMEASLVMSEVVIDRNKRTYVNISDIH